VPVEVAGQTTAVDAEIDVTMPASIANFDGIQIWRDGQLVAGVSRNVGAGAVQRIEVAGLAPNRTYVFQFKGYDAPFPGVESQNYSPSVSITTPAGMLPTPTLALSSWYNVSGQGFFLRVTPGANTPVGTRYRVQHGTSATGPWFDVESELETTIFHTHVQNSSADVTDFLRVRATHPDWTDSAQSSVVSIVIPRGVPGHF
jgi:hypothetical protein